MVGEVAAIRKQSDFRAILNEFRTIKGFKAVALVGRDGFVVESITHVDLDMEALGAMVATAIGTSESLGAEFNLGPMDQYLAEYKDGKVVMATVHSDILAVFTDAEAVVGAVRYAMRKNLPLLEQAM